MESWDNNNKGLGATWMIEKAISMLGGNSCTVVEFGAGNGRLLNFIIDIGLEECIGYDTNTLEEGRLVKDKIIDKDVTTLKLSGDICLAFDFFNNDNQHIIKDVISNFAVVIGSGKSLEFLADIPYKKFDGYKNSNYFIASQHKGIIKTLCSPTVFDYLLVGRFSGITPSVRKVIKSLRNTSHSVMTTIPRSNGAETFKWCFRNNIKFNTVMMNNTSDWEPQLRTECRKAEVPLITYEDGFIPHYSSLHFDYRGFCWDSSFPDLNVYDYDNIKDDFSHIKYDRTRPKVLKINKPFVFVPLQMVGDSVILHGSDVKNWNSFVNKVRENVPEEYDLVVKNHPREKESYISNRKDIHVINEGLGWAIENCEFVVGVNSGVLYEAAIIFNKPVYYYGRSWYDKHPMVCVPARGILQKYEITAQITEYRQRFWQLMKSHQLDYTKSFNDQKLVQLIKNEVKRVM